MSDTEKGPDPRWSDEALDRLRDAIKAMPEAKNQAGSNPSKEEPRG